MWNIAYIYIYILIYRIPLYIAFWVVICYLPPFMGARNNHWLKSDWIWKRNVSLQLYPWRLTWNIIMEVWKMIFLFNWVICMFRLFIFQGVLCDIGAAIRVTRDDVFSYELRIKRTLESSKSQGSQWSENFESLASPLRFDSSPPEV